MGQKQIAFTKMQGAGNDFIVIDAQKELNYRNLAKMVCDRTFGIGADGLLVLDKSSQADYRMHIINADGSVAEMCGNGVRCLAAYIARAKGSKTSQFTIETMAGIINAQVNGEKFIVQLSDPKNYQPDIPIEVLGQKIQVHFINTGVPHAIVFVDDLKTINVPLIGREIRYHERFAPAGTNVNFVEQLNPDKIAVRTYERGVEDETKACGTGSVAAAIVTSLKANAGMSKNRIKVITRSGEQLEVIFNIEAGQARQVWLKGSAKFIAQGVFYL